MNYPNIRPIKTDLTLNGRIILECIHADTCLSDYWSGHHLPHVQIIVWHGMTLREIKSELKTEILFGYVNGNCDAARLLNFDDIETREQNLANKLQKACIAAINKIKPTEKGKRKYFTDLEKDDHSETVYAYFVFRDENQGRI